MIDPVSLSIALGGILIAVIGYIKKSSCFGVNIETRTPKVSSSRLPSINYNALESEALLNDMRHPRESISNPIDIPRRANESKRIYL